MNNQEREWWVKYDDYMYAWWTREMDGEKKLAEFIRTNKRKIDKEITKAIEGHISPSVR